MQIDCSRWIGCGLCLESEPGERHSVLIVLIQPSLKASWCTAVFSGTPNMEGCGCLSNGTDNYCYWLASLFELLNNGCDKFNKCYKNLIVLLIIIVFPSLLLGIYGSEVLFNLCLFFFFSQKSWTQQADRHQYWSFGQPSQLERAVSKRTLTHIHWFPLRQSTASPLKLSNGLMGSVRFSCSLLVLNAECNLESMSVSCDTFLSMTTLLPSSICLCVALN